MSRKRKKKAARSTGVTTARLVDLSNFIVAFDTYRQILALRDIDKDPLLVRGEILAKRFTPALQEALEAHIAPIIADRPDASIFRPMLKRAQRPGTPKTVAPQVANLLVHFLPWLRMRQPVFRTLFTGRAAKAAREVAMVIQEEALESRLNKAATVVPVSGLMIPRKWIERAAASVGVPITAMEGLRTEAQVAQDLATKLQVVETKLQATSPQTPDAANMEEERLLLLGQMEQLADQSTNPEVVKAIAVTPSTHPEYATETGKKLGMTPEQEEAMMLTGKGIIAAGAGAGKTRVLAGKVVDTISRLGARSSQIIATSFSKKSSAELTSRVKSYGGDSILDAGHSGFGTTHSIGKQLLHEFDPGVPRGTRVQEPGPIVRQAMEQVKMMPSSYGVKAPEPKGMFEGILGAMALDTPDESAAPVTPASPDDPGAAQFQKLMQEMLGLARWGAGGGRNFGWAQADLRLLEPLVQSGKGPADLSGSERAAINKLLGTKRGQKKLKNLGVGPGYKVAKQPRVAAKSPYWKQAANQWFNIGLLKFEDSRKRAIGSRRFETAISQYRADLITPSQAWSKDGDQFAAVYGAYTWLKDNDPVNAGSIDFDDMLQKAVAVLVRNPRALAAVQARFRHILVDEAQDLNRMQHLMFGLIAGTIDPAKVSDSREIPTVKSVSYDDGRMSAETFVFIGDDKQAIYEFRGARPDEFIEKSDLVGGEFNTVLLATNFRSGEAIVDAANRLIAHNCVELSTPIQTPSGDRFAKDIQVGDEVLTYRNGELHTQKVVETSLSDWDHGLQITTASGHSLAMSPNHRLWASEPLISEEDTVVYLMYRQNLGFRVGTTKHGGQISRGHGYSKSFGGGRAAMEYGERLWVLGIYPTKEEALFVETSLSLRYQIPMTTFNECPRGPSTNRISEIFEEFGGNGSRLLEDRELSVEYPHWAAQSQNRNGRLRRVISLISHAPYGSDVYLRGTTDKKTIRRRFQDYHEAQTFAATLAHEEGGLLLVDKMLVGCANLHLTTASALLPGMQVPVLSGDNIEVFEILDVTPVQGTFVDIGVGKDSNFFGGGVLSHNSRQIPMVCDSNPEKGKGSIYNVVVEDHEAAAMLTADEIQQATSGEGSNASYSDFGVACRTNAEAYAFGVEMIRRGIPFRSKVNFFNDATTKSVLFWLRLAAADAGDKNTINECVLNAYKAPKFWLDKTFDSAIQREARGQNYLEFLRDGGWQHIYGQAWRNRANVKPYTDTLVRVFNMEGTPEELMGQILTLEGSEFKGVRQTIVDSLVDRVKGSGDAMDLLHEELGSGQEVSDEAIRNMALAPIQPMMSLIGGYEDVGPALEYIGKLQRVNEKKGKRDNPDAEDYKEPAVVIDTVHGWKGLEVPHLYVPMARGVFPHKRSEEEGGEAMASERRLAYVALTRGEQSVTVLNPMVTHTGQDGGVSPFVDEACIKPPGHEEESTDTAPARTAFLQKYVRGDYDDESGEEK